MDASLLSSFTSIFESMLLNVWVLSLIHLSKITHTWVNLHHPESTNYSTFLLQVTHHNGSLWMQRFTHYFEFNLLGFFCCGIIPGALTIWMELSVIPGQIQMERFIPVENFRKKKAIPFEVFPFPRFYRNSRKFLYYLSTLTAPGSSR